MKLKLTEGQLSRIKKIEFHEIVPIGMWTCRIEQFVGDDIVRSAMSKKSALKKATSEVRKTHSFFKGRHRRGSEPGGLIFPPGAADILMNNDSFLLPLPPVKLVDEDPIREHLDQAVNKAVDKLYGQRFKNNYWDANGVMVHEKFNDSGFEVSINSPHHNIKISRWSKVNFDFSGSCCMSIFDQVMTEKDAELLANIWKYHFKDIGWFSGVVKNGKHSVKMSLDHKAHSFFKVLCWLGLASKKEGDDFDSNEGLIEFEMTQELVEVCHMLYRALKREEQI